MGWAPMNGDAEGTAAPSGGDHGWRGPGWPPHCCVAAFLAAALQRFGQKHVGGAFLARGLGISVAPSSPNPWGLRVEADPQQQGLTVRDAVERIPGLLGPLVPGLTFRHIRFSCVSLGLVGEVLTQAVSRGCVAGVGYDLNRIEGPGPVLRHVTRIALTADPEQVVLLDDSKEQAPSGRVVRWMDLLPAVHAVDDGFWLVGRSEWLHLDYVP